MPLPRRLSRMMILLLYFTSLGTYPVPLLSQEENLFTTSKDKEELDSIQVKVDNEIFKGKTDIPNPFSLRDPFQERRLTMIKKDHSGSPLMRNGIFTNLASIEDISLQQLKITGVFIGSERRAMALTPTGENVILKEGMMLGPEKNNEIKAITPGGIVLVERITNVYGQEEYLETVIPISENIQAKKK